MRVGVLSYPMLFQRHGGLQVQIREPISERQRLAPVVAHDAKVNRLHAG